MAGRVESFSEGVDPTCDICGESTSDGHGHIKFSDSDRAEMRAIYEASQMHAQMSEHMRTAPVDLNDHAALLSHLQSPGHYEDTHANDMSVEELRQIHEDDHKMQEEEYGDDADKHTTLDDSHFHH